MSTAEGAVPLRLSVVIAAYNEEATIEAIVDRVRAVPLDIEIVAVNDASRDRTGEVLERLAAAGAGVTSPPWPVRASV